MLILKRLVVWAVETLCEALLLMVFLTTLWRQSGQSSLIDDLWLTFVGTVFVFMVGSGYLLTTALVGVVWRSARPWVYPTIAAALFVIHVQFFATGWTLPTRAPVQMGGASIVFACAFIGNWFLRRWSVPRLGLGGIPGDARV
jgi:hypothetical protein